MTDNEVNHSPDQGSGTLDKALPALVTVAIGGRALFATGCGLRPRKLMTEMFGSRFDGRSGTVFGLIFTGTDAAIGSGMHRSRTSPRRLSNWLLAGAAIDLVHVVLASTNQDVGKGRRRATAGMIGGLAVTGAALAGAVRKSETK
ncbi:hypothetical protein [Amycolatopsis nigrescens]|uniref:hypothetical protein n=1 Tax=Amycolatopsis nigrescens TaxID=381445 RepID=UPI00037AD64A|nr:hypothetical protein [Amycolatopsis nigrescens]